MAIPSTSRVNRILDGYASAWENWLIRVERAADEGTANRYSPEKWMSDVVTTWSDAMSVWYLPYTVCDERQRVVEFAISTTTDEATEGISIPDPGTDALTATAISRTGGFSIPVANIALSLIQNRRTLVVRLFGLQGLGTKLTPGEYTGTVAPTATPSAKIAGIKVTVT